jgi:cytochrome c553
MALAAGFHSAPAAAQQSLSCALCHHPAGAPQGADSLTYRPYPQIAGMPARYIQRQLHAFRSGLRPSSLMRHIALGLTPDEIDQWAGSYAAARPTPLRPVADVEAGARIAREGLWERGVPACDSCHGAGDDVRPGLSPALAGLPESYLSEQLRAYASGARRSDPMGRMRAFAGQLDRREMAALAAYYAAAEPDPAGSDPAEPDDAAQQEQSP